MADMLDVQYRQRVGAKIQCSSCYTAYHPLCARIAGLYMNMVDASDGQEDGAVRLISYCPKHCTPHPELAGMLLLPLLYLHICLHPRLSCSPLSQANHPLILLSASTTTICSMLVISAFGMADCLSTLLADLKYDYVWQDALFHLGSMHSQTKMPL